MIMNTLLILLFSLLILFSFIYVINMIICICICFKDINCTIGIISAFGAVISGLVLLFIQIFNLL